jgi:2-iminoacetate synthase
MEFSVPGFIKRYCQPNAVLTLAEYLEDYAPDSTKIKGYKLIEKEINALYDAQLKTKLVEKLAYIKQGKRDLYF